MTSVWVLRGHQSDFAQLTAEMVDHTLEAAGLGGAQIGVIHVANAFEEIFAAQEHPGCRASHRPRRPVGRPARRQLPQRAGARCRAGDDGHQGAAE